MTKSFLLWAALLSGSAAYAGGFQVALQGQRQIGMGHTGTALAYDASSIFFNPGGLTFTKVNNVMLGGSFIRSRVAYLAPSPSDYTAQTESPLGTPFMAYASFGNKEGKLRFGFGAYTPYGSSVKWADNWKGNSVLQNLQLQSIFFQPTVSYKLTEKLGLGVGFVYAVGGVELNRAIGEIGGTANLKGSASGMGFNAGLHFQLNDRISLGASYRSQVKMKVEGGDATFTVPASAIALGTFPAGGKTNFDASLPLPAVANIGVGVQLTEKLLVSADINYTFWSAYKELRFDYADAVNGQKSTVSPRNYKDAPTYRIGAEYRVSENLALRGGAYYDLTPVELGYMTPETPDANRTAFSAGLGYSITKSLRADASFLFIRGAEREQTLQDMQAAGTEKDVLAGTYKLRVIVPGISLSFVF